MSLASLSRLVRRPLVRCLTGRDGEDGQHGRTADGGFTLIELLVVMIIIGILAAVAIPVFLSQRAKAQDVAVKADVTSVGKEIATYYVDGSTAPTVALTSGRYVVGGKDVGKASTGVGVVSTYGTNATVTTANLDTSSWTSSNWCIALTDPAGSQRTYKYSAQNGLGTGQCTSATQP